MISVNKLIGVRAMTKRLLVFVLVLSLLLGSFALAGGDGSQACLAFEKADYKDLRNEFYDLEDDFFQYRSEYRTSVLEKDTERQNLYGFRLQGLDEDLDDLLDDVRDLKYDIEDAANCSSQDDLLDDLRDLKNEINDLRDDLADVLIEEQKMALPKVVMNKYGNFKYGINEFGWKEEVPTPTAAAKQSEVVVSTLTAGPTQPTSAVTATVTLEKANSVGSSSLPLWESTRQTVWLVAGVIVLLAVVLFLLGMLFRR